MTSRASVYPSAAASQATLANLSNCIASVDFACRTLEASNAYLAEQTHDLTRLARVLRSKRHFDLVSEHEIRTARNHLSAEIAPQLKELIVRAEEALQRDERKSKTLKGKTTQQTLRLEQLAQLNDVSLEQIRRLIDEQDSDGAGAQEAAASRQDEKRAQQLALEVSRLRQKAKSVQSKRSVMQRDMAQLEKDIQRLEQGKTKSS